jgi:hypothetical protein
MNCTGCGQKFRVSEVTLADANPPGLFFRIALFFWAMSAITLFYNGILFLAAGLAAIISTGAMITSTWDTNGGYGKPKCPYCEAENTVRFWQL